MSQNLNAVLRLTKIALQSKEFNEDDLIDFLENHFDWVKKEGNGFGIWFYDETAYNTRKETPYYFLCNEGEFKELHEFNIYETFKRYYSGTDTVDSTVDILESSYNGKSIWANVDWESSQFYFDFEEYPQHMVDEFEEEEVEEENNED